MPNHRLHRARRDDGRASVVRLDRLEQRVRRLRRRTRAAERAEEPIEQVRVVPEGAAQAARRSACRAEGPQDRRRLVARRVGPSRASVGACLLRAERASSDAHPGSVARRVEIVRGRRAIRGGPRAHRRERGGRRGALHALAAQTRRRGRRARVRGRRLRGLGRGRAGRRRARPTWPRRRRSARSALAVAAAGVAGGARGDARASLPDRTRAAHAPPRRPRRRRRPTARRVHQPRLRGRRDPTACARETRGRARAGTRAGRRRAGRASRGPERATRSAARERPHGLHRHSLLRAPLRARLRKCASP